MAGRDMFFSQKVDYAITLQCASNFEKNER